VISSNLRKGKSSASLGSGKVLLYLWIWPPLPQHKVLEDKLAFTSRKRAAASLARNLAFNHFGTNFYSDYSIERMAVGTNE
jgi:hypothetical protein